MATNSSGHNGSNTKKTNSWPAQWWFALFCVGLVAWTALYLFCHSKMGISGYEHSRFTAADIRHVNSILVSTDNQSSYNSTRQTITNTNDGFLDTYPTDSTEQTSYIADYPETNRFSNLSAAEDSKERIRIAMIYIRSQYGSEVDPAQLENIEQYIGTFTPRETGIFLADYRLNLKSYFWLTGNMVYAEVVFWVIFGVLCSLLFFTGNAIRKGEGWGRHDLLYQSARLFYAPFSAIILVLAYSYLKGGATLHVEAGEGIIVMAFLLGMYSGAFMELLDRIRVSIFNINTANNTSAGQQPAYTPPNGYTHLPPQPVQQTPPWQEPVFPQQHSMPYEDDDEAEMVVQHTTDTVIQQKPLPQVKEKRKTLNDDNEITEVDIDLKLDFSGLFDEERTQLQRLGFSKAIVTLHNVNGKDIIPAKKLTDDMTTFVATDVRPGIYIARATLSQRLKDDQIINLFGEKTAYITEDKPGLELFVKKYEAAD